jgi:glycerol-3-phosphate O-acyltransferase/dihydroxyacetone phosphate acyltransferase
LRLFLYRTLTSFLSLVTRVFFRTVEVVGLEHVPKDGPVIFAGNHPNSLMDPVLITTTCQRQVRFAAKDTLFKSPFLRPFLWVLGSVPIRRRMDHGGDRIDNSDAFSALYEVLEQGAAFGIFPEGISNETADLAPLKTGAARIAIGAHEKKIPVVIVPSGLSYRRRERMRSRVLVQFGAPIVLDEALLALQREDPREAARRLTAQIEEALRAQTINAPDFDVLRVLDCVRRLYKPEGMSLALAEQAELMRRFVESWERLKETPEIASFYRDVQRYLGILDALDLSDRDLSVGVSRWGAFKHFLGHLTLMLVFVPLALPGILLHLPVIGFAVLAGSKFTSRTDVQSTVKMCITTAFTLATYGVAVVLVYRGLPFPYDIIVAPLVLLGLLTTGWATIRVLERQAAIRHGFSVFFRLMNLKHEMVELRAMRDGLRRRILDLVDRYAPSTLERVIERHEQDVIDL